MQLAQYLNEASATRARIKHKASHFERLLRRLDALGALLILMALSPLIAVLTALLWLSDGAPLIYGHWRVGANGKLFRCLKLRTMVRNSEQALAEVLRTDPVAREQWEREFKLTSDPRITPIGNFLRRTSLDELPQLINVVRGEMSLVGPRPITVKELALYGDVRWHYFAVRPGMTGLWQVSGRNNVSYAERVGLDRRYVETRSLRMDLGILVKTVKVVATREGAR